MLDMTNILNISKKPELYQKGTAVMWTDPYISRQLLNVHLDPDIDLASRKRETIETTIKWVLEKAGGENLNILDLGCGPGLYSQLLAQKGHQVTGVDFSKHSITHAMKQAEKNGLEIDYRCQNYLELDDTEKYDLVLLIFTDFGALTPDERATLLSNVHRALKPGGCFLFDVLNDDPLEGKMGEKTWEISEKGFWRDKPYLLLCDSHPYPDEKVMLSQHCVIDEDAFEIYRFWTHFFSHEDLRIILSQNKFSRIKFYENVLPDSEMYRGQQVTFTTAIKDVK